MLCGLLIAIGAVALVQGLLGRGELPGAALAVGPAVIWLGGWVWLCAWVVWTYRRQVPRLAASDDPVESARAPAHADVSMQFTIRELTGVDVGWLPRTAAARFVNGQWPLVGHAAAIGLLVIAAAIV